MNDPTEKLRTRRKIMGMSAPAQAPALTAPCNGIISGCYPLDEFYKNREEADRLADVKKRQKQGMT
jgi:hypothetical protein